MSFNDAKREVLNVLPGSSFLRNYGRQFELKQGSSDGAVVEYAGEWLTVDG